MIKITRANWFGWTGAALILATLIGGFFSALIDQGISSSETAGWVQAIGSIAAILATIYVMNEQHKKTQRAAELLAREQRLSLLGVARSAGAEVLNVVGILHRSINSRDLGAPGALIYCSANLRDVLESIAHIPVWQMGSVEAAAFTKIRRVGHDLLAEWRMTLAEQAPEGTGKDLPQYIRVDGVRKSLIHAVQNLNAANEAI